MGGGAGGVVCIVETNQKPLTNFELRSVLLYNFSSFVSLLYLDLF